MKSSTLAKLVIGAFLLSGLAACTDTAQTIQPQPEAESASQAEGGEVLVIKLKDGDVRIRLRPDLAPKHVERIKALAAGGEYNNVAFHRVIDGFMAQTGDVEFADKSDGFRPERAGTGGSNMPDLPAEFSNEPFVRGTVGMARAQNPNSANSQFFIMLAPAAHLNGSYTVVGTVESGMDRVDNIKKGDPNLNGTVDNPDAMLAVTVEAKS